ncbi:DEAD/DEAH box helicase family protein [Streptomyces radiopugnans]|uniref:DEAD/DEAH box helicase family protein n=1 Tax=Streptomyces radiopugnans TaxID=403935 RepID=UPI003F1C9945
MKKLMHVLHDQAAVADTAARLQLRKPNAAALEAVAKATAASRGTSLEVVCSMATGVGKTYLAAGLVDYFVAQGVRNFLIVTPGSTVQRKTVENFTAGHPKSVIDGLECVPVLITAENFNTSDVAAALEDDEQVKLFVFNIQGLTPPKKNAKKRTHGFTEWLGGDLYRHLSELSDLVILSDEHHTYSQDAEVFSKTVRTLEPVVLVGLTATPAPADFPKVVFDYPLARAIADGFVKTPVLVGRTDSSTDRELQLRDGLALLAAKQKLADAWAEANNRERVNAVMFVVAESIAEADEVGELLRKPGLFEHDYTDRVLIIHSDASEDALMRLTQIEDPDSKVRVIVSVSMLKEGWDVKNIFVICSFRPSVSDTLTEQTLGRGLRLPWGAYTGQEFLDTVEVLSHERYADILARADVLLDGLVARRIDAAVIPSEPISSPSGEKAETTTATNSTAPHQETAQVSPGAQQMPSATKTTARSSEDFTAPAEAVQAAPGVGPQVINSGPSVSPPNDEGRLFADIVDEEPAPAVVGLEDRKNMGRKAADIKPHTVQRVHDIIIPRVRRIVAEKKPLALSSIPDSDFRALGQQMATHDRARLSRMEFRVVEDPNSPNGLKLIPTEVDSVVVNASLVELPLEDVRRVLKQGLLAVKFVSSTKPADGTAAKRLADAFIAGAGGPEKVAPYANQAIVAMTKFLAARYKQTPDQFENQMDDPAELPSERSVLRKREANRYGAFDRGVSYTGWSSKAAYDEAWFHSEPERAFANLLDSKDSTVVKMWSRLYNEDLVVEWEGGRYNPDFVFTAVNGINYLVEVKGEDRLEDKDVLAKRKAAADWARFVTDDGSCGEWRYLFVPQSEVRAPIASLIARFVAE